jgi:YVTN family beta-propeller protein
MCSPGNAKWRSLVCTVGLENDDELIAIDTLSNRVIATVGIGQAPQAVTYVPNAVPGGTGTHGLEQLGVAGQAAHLTMHSVNEQGAEEKDAPTSVTLFDQGLVQVLQASVTELEPTLFPVWRQWVTRRPIQNPALFCEKTPCDFGVHANEVQLSLA